MPKIAGQLKPQDTACATQAGEHLSNKNLFKGLVLLVALFYGGSYFLTGDLLLELPANWFTDWLSGVFKLMDQHGFLNVWSGQSPGTHYLYYLLWKPAQALGSGSSVEIIFSVLWYFLSMGAVFLGIFYFYKIVERMIGPNQALILGLVYTILVITFKWYTVVDSIPLTAFLGAVYFVLKGSPTTGGLMLGIGSVIKPFGMLLIPVVLKSEFLSKKAKILFIGLSTATFSLLFLPFVIGNFRVFLSSFNWQAGRPPWETVYALIQKLLDKPIPQDVFFQDYSGVAQRDWGWTGITPDHSVMTMIVPDYSHWYSLVFVILMAVIMGGFIYSKNIRTENQFIWGLLFALGGYFTVFYGWSANFFYWLIPFLLILLPIWFSVSFKLLVLLEYPFLYGLYLVHIAPDLVSSVSGLPSSVTMALAPLGIGFWIIIVIKTAILAWLSMLAWKTLPTKPLTASDLKSALRLTS
ncbi:hypothetical protein [Dehalogenimonas sp. 4OHTPN]|uniref:DUF2029 domain-containing protein n=1 Tax=Dehalogenimonas sp. 4OHTPN TaxID=3166643 RepID=A0AAU8G9K1_9CHLR